MKRETRRNIRELAYYSSLGLSVALSIFIGLAAGIYLDRYFQSSPWLTLDLSLPGNCSRLSQHRPCNPEKQKFVICLHNYHQAYLSDQ